MAEFVGLWQLRGSLLHELHARISDADDARDIETASAIAVQRHFRGSQVRAEIILSCFAAAEIQRFFRGFVDRKRVAALKDDAAAAFQDAVDNYAASQIQRTFRGFYSRRYTHDYFARRAYVIGVVKQGEALRGKLTAHLEDQIVARQQQEEAEAEAEFDKATQNLHHLVSTASIRGVYNPVYAQDASEVPSAFNVPIETHLRVGVKRFLRTKGLRTGSAFADGEGRGTRSYVGSATGGGLNPGEHRRTLRSSTVYGEEAATAKTAERHSKLRHLAPRAFTAGTRMGKAHHVKSIHNQGPYVPPGTAGVPDRTLDSKPSHKARRTGTAVGQAAWRGSTAPVGGLFEEHALEALPSTAASKAAGTARMLRTQGRGRVAATPLLESTARAISGGVAHLLPSTSVRDLAGTQSASRAGAPPPPSTAPAMPGTGTRRFGVGADYESQVLRKSVDLDDVSMMRWPGPPPSDPVARKRGLIQSGKAALRTSHSAKVQSRKGH